MNIAVLGSTNGISLETVLQLFHSNTLTQSPESNINISVIISNRKKAGIIQKGTKLWY